MNRNNPFSNSPGFARSEVGKPASPFASQPATRSASRATLGPDQSEKRKDKSAVLDQAYEEYCQRLEAGESVDADAFCVRFPTFQTSLRRLLQAHQFLQDNPELLADYQAQAWPLPGQTFCGFSVVQELGQGAFARVFLATEPALGNRPVAVKVSLLGAGEAETLGRLIHPNIVPVHSVQVEPNSGQTVICMPYLGCATLCDVLDRAFAGPQRPDRAALILEAAHDEVLGATAEKGNQTPTLLRRGSYIDGVLSLAVQLAEALHFVHSLGICHRDLKPSNVLLRPDGTPMLLDFNLAADRRNGPQAPAGTLPYMAPELLQSSESDRTGLASTVDFRSDLFSLGVVLYELLSGVHPFGPIPIGIAAEELLRTLVKKHTQGPRPLRQVNAKVNRALARTVEQCLALRPEERPSSAAHLARALRRQLSLPRRLRRWLACHPWITAGATSMTLGTILAVACFFAFRDPYPDRQYRYGVEAYQQGQFQQAVHHFNNVLQERPTDGLAQFARGRAYQQMGDDASIRLALADYSAAIKLTEDGRVMACYAYCLNHKGGASQQTAAIFWYQRALEAGYTSAGVHNNLGCTFLTQGKFDEARPHLDEAIRLDKNLQAAYHNRALACLLKHEKDRKTSMQGGIDDIARTIELARSQGNVTADLFRDGAWLCARAAEQDPHWIHQALDYVEQAVAHGYDVKKVRTDPVFAVLSQEKRFQQVQSAASPSVQSRRSRRLVDPVAGLP